MKTNRLSEVVWKFPLARPHMGLLLGNAQIGFMVWGEGSRLCVTVGRADAWDHQGGAVWREDQTYANIRTILEAGNAEKLAKLFEDRPTPGEPVCPQVMPIGRVEFHLPANWKLERGVMDLGSATGVITLRKGARRVNVRMVLDMKASVLHIAWPAKMTPQAKAVPAWDSIRDAFVARNFIAPSRFENGWIQTFPKDPELCCAWDCARGRSVISATRPRGKTGARNVAERALRDALAQPFAVALRASREWWRSYWAKVPEVRIPNPTLQHLYDYGMYKFAGLTEPHGVPATLQGPWVEDYQLPPWSNDYHFNINVQMCYWPAYHANLPGHLLPMFRLVLGWHDKLARNAKTFAGIDDGYMLPHATSDTGTCVGCGFWTGMMDHGCTMWIAEMMYRYVRYSGDTAFLREAYAFMVRTVNLLGVMLEETPDGALAIPVSISPEYRGQQMNAWGRNASAQLASAHRLAEDLVEAAVQLGETPPAICQRILDKLPKASLFSDGNRPQIALWDGLVLEESHRHHAHFSAIVPFDTIDCESPEWRDIVYRTFEHWIYRGAGLWSGWCVPWASMLHTRVGNADCAALWLEIWQRLFVNHGHGTRHDAAFPGLSLMGARAVADGSPDIREIMQMDAGMGCVAAIQEMLLHDKRGVNFLFKGAPTAWADASFENMLAPGGVLVSAIRRDGRVTRVKLTATRAAEFRLANPWPAPNADAILTVNLKRGQTVTLKPQPPFGEK